MLNKSDLVILPEKEMEVYEQLKKLSMPEKRLLFKLIQDVDKNGVALHTEENSVMLSLIKKGYVTKNEAYRGRGYSYFVLVKAPHLLNVLKNNIRKYNKKPETNTIQI